MMPDQKTKFNPKTNFYKEDTCNLNSLEAKGLLQNQRTSFEWDKLKGQALSEKSNTSDQNHYIFKMALNR